MDYDLENNSSDCSSGCESGWTMYLDNSSFSPYESQKRDGILDCEKKGADHDYVDNDDDEEDMSMVSDASSGPPHFQEEEDEEVYPKSNRYHASIHDATLHKRSGKMKKSKDNITRKILEQPSFLDDTASSPVFNFSNNNYAVSNNYASAENLSQGYSTTHFEGRSGYYHHQQGHYDYCHSTISGNNVQQNQWFQERRWL